MNVPAHACRRAFAVTAATAVLGLGAAAPALAQTSPPPGGVTGNTSPPTSPTGTATTTMPPTTTTGTATTTMPPTSTTGTATTTMPPTSTTGTATTTMPPTSTTGTATTTMPPTSTGTASKTPKAVKAGTGGQAGQNDDGLVVGALAVGGAAAVAAGWVVTRRKGAHL